MDFKKLAKDIKEDSSEVFKDIKNKANPKKIANSLNPEKLKDSIENTTESANKSKEGDVIVNVTDGVKRNIGGQFEDLARATSSIYTSLSNNLSEGMDNTKAFSPDKLVSGMFKKVWKENYKVLGFSVTRGQKITYSLSFIFAAVLFLGMDLSLLFITHEFENVKYSIFFSMWALSFLIGIRILDSAVPEQFFEKKSKTIRTIAVIIYTIAMITCIVLANVLPSWNISLTAFIVHFITFGWLLTTHMPTFKGLNLSYFTEKTPLLFSSFYNSTEK